MNKGLNTSQVYQLRKKYGKNVLQETNPYPLWRKLLDQFTDLMVIILIISALIAVGVGVFEGDRNSYIDGLVILGIVFLNAAIGFIQEYRTEKALEALKKLISPHAIVIREGIKRQVEAEDIVPGDLVVLSAGDRIVADGVLIECAELRTDEAPLTGESIPVHKSVESKVFMGTTVVAGKGLMEVIHTGMKTSFGKIAHLTTATVRDKSPLQKELFHIGVFVTKLTVIISAVLIITGIFIQGESLLDSLLFAVSVAVAAVPEGLPATITIALALGVQKMARKHAVIKKLSSIETLGSTTVICSDKTGTLTKNEMTVTRLLLGQDQILEVSGTGYDPKSGVLMASVGLGKKISQKPHNAQYSKISYSNLEKIRLISTYCTEAELQKKGKRYSVLGDPTEGALLTMARKGLQGDKKPLQRYNNLKIIETLPFDSSRKMMSVIVSQGKTQQILTKGSPDQLIGKCTHILRNGRVMRFTPTMKHQVIKTNESMASEALRVIGFAFRDLKSAGTPHSHRISERNLVFVGLAGMIDPPREEVPEAVRLCQKAGIRTIIVTGDHGLTAKAIAVKIGIADEQTSVVLGEDLEKMTDKHLDKVLKQRSSLIFSRVNPEHKRRIVDRLKLQGEIVAVTGDGVNDAPALKRADLGIAMGITGTEVSKETASMILLDDSFASIIAAVREGRKIYNNLRKFIWFIFSCNIGELLTVFSAIIFQIPAPLTAALILAIDLGTDILPAIALGVDHAEPDVMERTPRDQKIRIMNRAFVIDFLFIGLVIGVSVIGIYWWKLSSLGWSFGDDLQSFDPIHIQASSLAFTTLVVIQLFNAFNARSLDYSIFRLKPLWELWGSVTVSMLLVITVIYVPFFQDVFHTSALSYADWVIVMGAGLGIIFIEELRKILFHHA